jgi:hypothetical protein
LTTPFLGDTLLFRLRRPTLPLCRAFSIVLGLGGPLLTPSFLSMPLALSFSGFSLLSPLFFFIGFAALL